MCWDIFFDLAGGFWQITRKSVRKFVATNYGNIFMDKFEIKLLSEYLIQISLSPLILFWFLDDIFFILTSDTESLHDLIQFAQDFSEKCNMKLKIKFDVNISQKSTFGMLFWTMKHFKNLVTIRMNKIFLCLVS